MANEITVQNSKTLSEGTVEWSLLYWFDITATPIEDNNGNTVIVQTSSQLPAVGVQYLSQAQKDSIDAGTAGFMQRTIRQTPGELTANFIARAKTDYSSMKTYWISQQQDMYGNQGLQQTVP